MARKDCERLEIHTMAREDWEKQKMIRNGKAGKNRIW